MAVKQIRVSDLSGKQVDDDQLAKLVIHEHPQYQGPITLDVLPEEIGELPDSDSYVSIEVIQPGDRTGQKALISLERFNKLAPDMPTIVMNAVASQASPSAPAPQPRRRRGGTSGQRGKVSYATLEHAGEPHRGRITEAEKELVRGNLERSTRGCGRPGCGRSTPTTPPCGSATASRLQKRERWSRPEARRRILSLQRGGRSRQHAREPIHSCSGGISSVGRPRLLRWM